MSKMRPKPQWWSFRTYDHIGRRDKQIENRGQRRLEKRIAQAEIFDETRLPLPIDGFGCVGCGERYCDGC